MSKTWFVLICPSSCNGANQHMLCDPQQQFLSATCWHWKLRTSLDRTPCNWHGKFISLNPSAQESAKWGVLKSVTPKKTWIHLFMISFSPWISPMTSWPNRGVRVPSHNSKRLRPGHPWTLAAAQIRRRELLPGRRNRSPAAHGKYHWEWGDLWIYGYMEEIFWECEEIYGCTR